MRFASVPGKTATTQSPEPNPNHPQEYPAERIRKGGYSLCGRPLGRKWEAIYWLLPVFPFRSAGRSGDFIPIAVLPDLFDVTAYFGLRDAQPVEALPNHFRACLEFGVNDRIGACLPHADNV